MRILAFILVAHALSANACEESFIMGTLPDGTSTNMVKRITIPAYSELKLNVYPFGHWRFTNDPNRLNAIVPSDVLIEYRKNGFVVYRDGFYPTAGTPRLIGPAELILTFRYSEADIEGVPKPGSGLDITATCDLVVYPPNKSVIIPAGSQGADISLESSTDLQIWTPATLGTYTAPTNNLFFRLKLNRL